MTDTSSEDTCTMPTVSIVIPTYNRADSLKSCIDSVIQQSIEDIEIIVVDDASNDHTPSVVSDYGDPRIQYIRHNKNKGAAAARNTGIESAGGDLIAFIDSDDEWMEDKLAKQLSVLEESPSSVGVVYTGHYVSGPESVRLGDPPSCRGDIYKKQLMYDRVNPTSTVLVKKECFDKVGEFNTSLPARQDYDMWLRISEYYEFEFVKEPLVTLHIDGEDRISSDYEQRMRANKYMLQKANELSKKYNITTRWKILSKQYESFAGFCYISKEFTDARKYVLFSIVCYPLGVRKYLLLPLILFSISPDNKALLRLKNVFFRLKTSQVL